MCCPQSVAGRFQTEEKVEEILEQDNPQLFVENVSQHNGYIIDDTILIMYYAMFTISVLIIAL